MAIPPFDQFSTTDEETGITNNSQDKFLDILFNEVLPLSLEKPQIVCLSGAYGSGKSLAVIYAINLLSCMFPKLSTYIGRISIDSVKKTFFKEYKEMCPSHILEVENSENLIYKNKSTVDICGWGGGDTTSLRSLNLNIAVIEEVTQDAIKTGYFELNKRALQELIGRIRGKDMPAIIFLVSNPDSPTHWMYDEYIDKSKYVNGVEQKKDNVKDNVWTFYSVTSDNAHNLNDGYIENILANSTDKQVQRYVYGQWVDIRGKTIYNKYDEKIHFLQEDYKIDRSEPVYLNFDFNVAENKPMSCCMSQYLDDHFNFFDELVIYDSNTRDMMEQLEEGGFFRMFSGTGLELKIDGDGTGWSKDSSSTLNNYDLMKDFLEKLPYPVKFEVVAPHSNPPIESRHNVVNSYFENYHKKSRISIYKRCINLDKGLRSARLKKNKEDDSNPFQHITTSFSYNIYNRTKDKGGMEVLKNFRG